MRSDLPIIIQVCQNGAWFSVESTSLAEVDTYKKNPPEINDFYDAWRAMVKTTKKVLWTKYQ